MSWTATCHRRSRAPHRGGAKTTGARGRPLPLMRSTLEQVDHAEHEATRLAADRDRVRVDVERVRRVAVVVELDVTGVNLRALAERIRVAQLPLVGGRIGSLGQTADARAVVGAALAVAGMTVERVPRARTHGDRAADAPHVALQVAARRVVLEALIQQRCTD